MTAHPLGYRFVTSSWEGLQDHNGNWVQGFTHKMLHGNSFLAEAIALRDGLQLVWNLGVRKLICESDCKTLVNAGQDRPQILPPDLGLLVTEIKNLTQLQWQVLVSWVPRDANKAADWMAKASTRDEVLRFARVLSPDPDLQVIILKDALGIPWFLFFAHLLFRCIKKEKMESTKGKD
ncbi:uncharacterized protein LOC130721007 [Lotus japonicus]|uniref:uncharacterized protein LOC130721007 n=1 Tax=Lotus japonicus TaxID=34305 RepID=UPI00258D0AD3|nr:uncharacterized protein LOC130721007 [Lotus japonicus]